MCATLSSESSLLLRNALISGRMTRDKDNGSLASDIMAKTANLTNFVINPAFHFLVASISLLGVIGSLVYSFPNLLVSLLPIVAGGAILVIALSKFRDGLD